MNCPTMLRSSLRRAARRPDHGLARLPVCVAILLLAAHPAGAQSFRAYQIEMDARLGALERRIEALEREKSDRLVAERQAESQRQRDAVTYLASECSTFRQSPADVKLFNDCAAQRKMSQPVNPQCYRVELAELTCHSGPR